MSVTRRTHRQLVMGRRNRVLSDRIAPLLPREGTVLDVGCGDGGLAAAIAERRPDVTITGVDVVVRPDAQIPVAEYDGQKLPYGDGSFDAAILVDVLHHSDDPAATLRDVSRVAPRAVVIKDHLADGVLAHSRLRFMDWFGNAGAGIAFPHNYWTLAQWQGGFASIGLEVQSETTEVPLYPPPASWIFGRGLHVIWKVRSSSSVHSPPA